MAYLTTTSTTQNSILARIASAADAALTTYKRHRLYRETFNGLSALSPRDLADLGLHRSELRAVAKESARTAAL